MKKSYLAFAGLALLAVATPAQAQLLGPGMEKAAIKEGFAFPAEGEIRIVVLRPDVHVGEQSTGGLNQPNAEWTDTAKKELTKALQNAQGSSGNKIVMMPELEGDDGVYMAEYRGMFKAVTDAVVSHKLFPGNRLPTKKEVFDWSLGTGTQKLGQLGGGEYGLFFYTYDSYGSAGRKAAQVVGMLFGVGVSSGVHIGYAGLVDLKTGDLVWINADLKMGGDVREPDGATKRVKQLLEDFPTRGTKAVVTVGG